MVMHYKVLDSVLCPTAICGLFPSLGVCRLCVISCKLKHFEIFSETTEAN